MELDQHNLLEELLSMRRESWENLPLEMSEFFTSNGSLECFQTISQENQSVFSQHDHGLYHDELGFSSFPSCDFGHAFSVSDHADQAANFDYNHFNTPFQAEEYCAMASPQDQDQIFNLHFDSLPCSSAKKRKISCKDEVPQEETENFPVFQSSCVGKQVKKVEGQPSKNLMAERRRRKRLNDRLSMLRSVVPKISKMDRTSTLGDTIEYVKELLERIKTLQEETQVDLSQVDLLSSCSDVKPSEIIVRNTPKFDVERRKDDTRIEIFCNPKPGLLLSTLTTLEALGLEVEQCVISCFSDFGMQASCSEDLKQRGSVSSEEIKQALFRNAGYSGRLM